jgi:hypothetical protein
MAVTRFPSGASYVEALQNTTLCFDEPDLKGAKVELDRLSRPKPISGNFASVFSVTADNGRRYAVKCFTREVADQEFRYRAISAHLASLEHDWKVGFDYLPHGIMVEGRRYPVLKMDWVEATSLTRWIDQHIHDPRALAGVADRFAALVGELASAGVAHGDLQHGNLLVTTDGSLRLVDYDGMYVPALQGIAAAEMGHRNYQSPVRSQTDFDLGIDRFSSWVIYLSLVAIAAEPTLWGQLHEQGGEYLLLAEDDFKDPISSSRFSVLLNHVAPEVRALVAQVQVLVGVSPSALPVLAPIALDSVRDGRDPAVASFNQPTVIGLPAWMVDHVPTAAPVREQGFADRGPAVVAASVLLGALLIAVLALGFVSAPLAALLVGVGAALWFGDLALLYLRRPETKAARRARERRDRTRRDQASATRELEAANRGLADHLETAARRADADRKRRLEIQERHARQLVEITRDLSQRLARVVSERNGLAAQQRQALDQALHTAQAGHVRARLEKLPISASGVEGIGDKLLASLRNANIVSAADFIGVSYSTNGAYQNRIAEFRLPSNYVIRVPGIGEVKAARLEVWRQQQELVARRTQPAQLPDGQRAVIEARFAAQLKQYDMAEQQIQAAAQQQKTVLNQQLSTDLAALAGSQRAAQQHSAQQQVQHNRLLSRCEADVKAADRAHESAAREALAYRRITYPRFLLFSFVGR